MGNQCYNIGCCWKQISQPNLAKEIEFNHSLVRVAVSDWFLIATHFDDLPDTVRFLLSQNISLTCNFIYQLTRETIEKDPDFINYCDSTLPKEKRNYPFLKKALTFMFQWCHDFLLSSQQDNILESPSQSQNKNQEKQKTMEFNLNSLSTTTTTEQEEFEISRNIIEMLIQIINCEEISAYRMDMDHVFEYMLYEYCSNNVKKKEIFKKKKKFYQVFEIGMLVILIKKINIQRIMQSIFQRKKKKKVGKKKISTIY